MIDALTLADPVVVLDGGRVVQQGPTRDVLARPCRTFAACLGGAKLVGYRGGLVDSYRRRHQMTDATGVVAVFTSAAVAVYIDPPKAAHAM